MCFRGPGPWWMPLVHLGSPRERGYGAHLKGVVKGVIPQVAQSPLLVFMPRKVALFLNQGPCESQGQCGLANLQPSAQSPWPGWRFALGITLLPHLISYCAFSLHLI